MPNKKKHLINVELRNKIIKGFYPAGSRLPVRSELESRFKASRQTVQNAINSLIRDGFVHASRSEGTFVSEKPPHLYNFGLVSPMPFSMSRYSMAMQQAALNLGEEGTYTFTSYNYEGGHIQSKGFRRLIADVEAHRVAGLIFVFPPCNLEGTPALEQPGLPHIINTSPDEYSNIPRINLGWNNFLEESVDFLVGHGRGKIAVIGSYLGRAQIETDLSILMKRKVSRPEWIQSCGLMQGSAYQAALILTSSSGEDRPDAVIIRDDNLVEEATEGIARSGLRIPQDLEVVAHCNFPDRAPSCVPVTRLGLDCRELLLRDVECLIAQREGRPFQHDVELPAVFESDIDSRRTVNGQQQAVDSMRRSEIWRQEKRLQVAI